MAQQTISQWSKSLAILSESAEAVQELQNLNSLLLFNHAMNYP